MPPTTSAAHIDASSAADRVQKQTAVSPKLVSSRPLMFEESVEPRIEGMSAEQRFLLDMRGVLILDSALSPAELADARAALVEGRYGESEAEHAMPPWCVTKAVERLLFHRSFWPVVMELLNGKPKLKGGQFICDDHAHGIGHVHGLGGHLHCAREDWGSESATFEVSREGQLRANDMIVFVYLTDVYEGDGGLSWLPGSHKNNFVRPDRLYGEHGLGSRRKMREGDKASRPTAGPTESEQRQGMIQLTARAGDIIVCPEATTHGVLPWLPTDRPRHVLGFRYHSQHLGGSIEFEDRVLERLSAPTRELLQYAHYTHTKAIATRSVVTLEDGVSGGRAGVADVVLGRL
eukprot:COSAG05_NODE_728_length_7700_cov_14.555979_1_plen_348_part_00